MKTKTFIYTLNDSQYEAVVTYKRIRSVIFRFRDDKFYISAPILAPMSYIKSNLDHFAPRLIKKSKIKSTPIEGSSIYILGTKVPLLKETAENVAQPGIVYKDDEDLTNSLKVRCLETITPLVRRYEKEMGIEKPYKIRVRSMKSRFGSNSRKTHTLSFQTELIHYDVDIISSVVVHELAHDKYFDHGQEFYHYIYEYCPNYWDLKKKLRKGVYH